jgi:hypothetical protein
LKREAVISPDGLYRYRLSRDWSREVGARKTLTLVMLNPSTADARVDDPTIRRCVGFALGWNFTRIDVVNLFAFRTPSPAAMTTQWALGVNVVGPDNDAHLRWCSATCSAVVFAWGAYEPGPKLKVAFEERVRLVTDIFRGNHRFRIGAPTKSGAPRHPLYLKASEQLRPWGGAP